MLRKWINTPLRCLLDGGIAHVKARASGYRAFFTPQSTLDHTLSIEQSLAAWAARKTSENNNENVICTHKPLIFFLFTVNKRAPSPLPRSQTPIRVTVDALSYQKLWRPTSPSPLFWGSGRQAFSGKGWQAKINREASPELFGRGLLFSGTQIFIFWRRGDRC